VNLITGRPLLNGMLGSFLIWKFVCPAQVGSPAFHRPLGREHKGRANHSISFCGLRFMDQKDLD